MSYPPCCVYGFWALSHRFPMVSLALGCIQKSGFFNSPTLVNSPTLTRVGELNSPTLTEVGELIDFFLIGKDKKKVVQNPSIALHKSIPSLMGTVLRTTICLQMQ